MTGMGVDEQQRLGQYLKDCRVDAGYTQSDVSAELGLKSAQSISNIERGVAPVPLHVLRKMIKLYKIPERQFMWLLVQLQTEDIRKKLFSAS